MKTNALLFITGCFIAQSRSAFLIRVTSDGKATEGNYNVVMDFGNILPLTEPKDINAPNEYTLVEKENMLWFVVGITGSEENKEKAVAFVINHFLSKGKVFRPHIYNEINLHGTELVDEMQ
ncbi:conserved hypothetical protein [Trichinella spiralis]|uniref:hypothetical protein n=1 Tax=Trichinella spiralis TaxID=6334 RepID=UPI0001EFC458|nr:conserved hypothetical protein [Trichinella spiralis]